MNVYLDTKITLNVLYCVQNNIDQLKIIIYILLCIICIHTSDNGAIYVHTWLSTPSLAAHLAKRPSLAAHLAKRPLSRCTPG